VGPAARVPAEKQAQQNAFGASSVSIRVHRCPRGLHERIPRVTALSQCSPAFQLQPQSALAGMPVRPGTVAIVPIDSTSLPDPKKQPPARGPRGAAQAPQPGAAESSQAAADSPPLPPAPAPRRPAIPALPGFGFKYLAQETPPADDHDAVQPAPGGLGASAPAQDAEAREAPPREQGAGAAGFQVGGFAVSPRVNRDLFPATCNAVMMAGERTAIPNWKVSRIGSPTVQSLHHEGTPPSDLAADLTDDSVGRHHPSTAGMPTMPESSGSAAFSSTLAALRQHDILSAHEVRVDMCVLVCPFVCGAAQSVYKVLRR